VTPLLRELLCANGGALTRNELVAVVGRDAAQRAVRRLARVFPAIYVDPATVADASVLRVAALKHAGPSAALSHVTALEVWGLPVPSAAREPVHVTTDRRVQLRPHPLVVQHRSTTHRHLTHAGLRVVPLEQAVVASWPLLSGEHQRAPSIVAVRSRRTTAARLQRAAIAAPTLTGRASLLALLELLAAGRHSPLEIWGHRHVFDHPSLPEATPQLRVVVGARAYYLDNPYVDEMVNVELDGSAYHGPEQRESDLRRDAALASLGWLTLRFSGRRLHREPATCRAETLAALEARRRWRAGA
jgi:hypothetical protein